MKTIIAVPDFTRHAHLNKILPLLIKKLVNEGLSHKDIEVIIATGLHKAPPKKEIRANLGNISAKIKISSHDYRKNHVAYFGKSKKCVPIYLNKKLLDAYSIITVGVVEPHLYAGYSGGVKVVSIGLAGEKTINATHHPRFLDHPGTKISSLKNNPFRAFIDEIGSLLPIKYSINIINDRQGRLLRIFKGAPRQSFEKAAAYCKHIFEKKVPRAFDAIICSIPKEKSKNIYQASRIFNYIVNSKNPPLKNNSLILVKASLEDGFGNGLGEKRFEKKILEMASPDELIKSIKKSGCLGGEHRAYMVAKAMKRARLGFITDRSSFYKNKSIPFLFFKDMEEAKDYMKLKAMSVYYLKNAFTTILVKD